VPDDESKWDDDGIRNDPHNKLRGGSKKKRDKWYGKRSDGYKKWFHRKIKPYLKPYDPKKFGKEKHDEWEERWKKLGCPIPKTLSEP